MAYEDAFLTKNQHLLFDTGSDRIDLTLRVDAGGWGMVTGGDNQDTIEPLTREAVYRIESATDWSLNIAGMYYNDDIPKVRAVKSAKAAFALGKQFRDNPRSVTAPSIAWFLGGHVVTGGIGVDGSGGIVKVPAVSLQEREPMVYGEVWREKLNFGVTQGSSIVYSGAAGTIDMADPRGRPVLMYDLRGFTQYLNQNAAVFLTLQTGTVGGNDEVTIQIQIPAADFRLSGSSGDNNRKAKGKVGMVDLADLAWDTSTNAFNSIGTAGALLSAWPTTGTYRVLVGVSNITNDTMDIGLGVGRRQVALDS